MKIGIISDIHSNIEGLRNVLEKLKGVDVILCAGDITGYYTFINEVINEIKSKNIKTIIGNHDAYLLKLILLPKNLIIKKSISYTSSIISKENLAYLKKIKKASMEVKIDNLKIKMYHGSPWNEFEEYIYPDYQNFDKFLKVNADLIILGHTHIPMVKKLPGKIIINPGSCGQPRGNDRRASFAIFNTKTKKIKIEMVEYDVEKVINEAKKNKIDKKLINLLKK